MPRRKSKLFPTGGLQSLYSKILWITPRRNISVMNEILEIIAYTQNAGSVFTASTGSVGLMLANDETHRNRIGLIWQKNNRQYPKSGDKDGHKDGCEVGYKYGHAVPVFSNHKYLIRKMIKAVR